MIRYKLESQLESTGQRPLKGHRVPLLWNPGLQGIASPGATVISKKPQFDWCRWRRVCIQQILGKYPERACGVLGFKTLQG